MNLKIAVALATITALPVAAQFHPDHRFSLSAGQVARAVAQSLALRGVTISESQVSLLANVVSKQPNPVLEVSAIKSLPDLLSGSRREARSSVLLACSEPQDCVPFYAIVRWPLGVQPVESTVATAHPVAASVAKPHHDMVMRAGAHATLVIADKGMEIRLNVVSLQSGSTGETIRVAGEGHRQVYEARVVNANLLKGSL